MRRVYSAVFFSFFACIGLAQAQPLSIEEISKQPNYFLMEEKDGALSPEGTVKLYVRVGEDQMEERIVNPDEVYQLYLYPDFEDTEFPMIIFNFPNVQTLWIGMRGYTTVPASISALKNLEYLDFTGTPIDDLPASIADLEHLKDLYLVSTNIGNDRLDVLQSRMPRCTIVR